MHRPRPDVGYWSIFATLAVAELYLVGSTKYLPMVDLPGHVAQLALIERTLGGTPLPPGFAWNLFTPYLTAYAVALPFAVPFSATVAVKVVLWLYLVATPLSVRTLLRTVGAETWWSLLFFPFALCHPFYWGFFPYLVATPVGVWALAAAIRASSRPTPPRVAGVAALGVLLLVSHVLVFGVALAMSVAYTLAESPGRRALRALVGWLPAGLLLVPWLVLDFERPSRGGWDWSLEPSRLLQLASGVAGDARDGPTGWAVLGAVAALGLVAGIRLRPRRGNLALAACGLALAALSPAVAFGISHLSWRLAFWFWLGCATLVAPLPSSPRRQIARLATGLALTLSAGWIGGQIRAFDRDARTFDPILAAMAPGKYLHPLLFDFQSAVGPSARHLHGYLHFGGWYYVEKRGLYAGMFRFAPQQLPIVRTAPLFGDRFTEDSSYWSAASFEREPAGAYDYYLLRQLSEKRAEAFLDSHPALEEIRRSGAWYLLRPAAAAR